MPLTADLIRAAEGELRFLFDFTYKRVRYRLATRELRVPSANGELQYRGLVLNRIEYFAELIVGEELRRPRAVALTLHIPGVDFMADLARSDDVQQATGELAIWAMGSDYADRMVILRGHPRDPEFMVDDDRSTITFSLQAEPQEDLRLLPLPTEVVTTQTWPTARQDALEKVYPIIIGRPGGGRVAGSPAHVIETTPNPAPNPPTPVKLLVARGAVQANTVDIIGTFSDEDDIVALAQPLVREVDGLGQTVTTAVVPAIPAFRDSDKFYIRWSEGGGLAGVDSSDAARNAADIVYVLLRSIQADADLESLKACRGKLSEYRFDGVIETAESVWDWLRGNVLPFLPAQLVAGPRGLRLEVWQHKAAAAVQIDAARDGWVRDGPIELRPRYKEVLNEIRVRYDFRLTRSAQSRAIQGLNETALGGDQSMDRETDRIQMTDRGIRSFHRYGGRGKSIQARSVYEDGTAKAVVDWMQRRHALPQRIITLIIPSVDLPRAQIGAIVHLVDEESGVAARGVIEGVGWQEGPEQVVTWREITG